MILSIKIVRNIMLSIMMLNIMLNMILNISMFGSILKHFHVQFPVPGWKIQLNIMLLLLLLLLLY